MWPLCALWVKEAMAAQSWLEGRLSSDILACDARKPGWLEYACDVAEWLEGNLKNMLPNCIIRLMYRRAASWCSDRPMQGMRGLGGSGSQAAALASGRNVMPITLELDSESN